MFVENGQQEEQTVTYKQRHSFLGCRAKASVQVLSFLFESSWCTNRLWSSFGKLRMIGKVRRSWFFCLMFERSFWWLDKQWTLLSHLQQTTMSSNGMLRWSMIIESWGCQRWLQTVSSENVLHMKTVKDKVSQVFVVHTNASLQTVDEIHPWLEKCSKEKFVWCRKKVLFFFKSKLAVDKQEVIGLKVVFVKLSFFKKNRRLATNSRLTSFCQCWCNSLMPKR